MDIYKDKKALVTGGTGLIGIPLVEILIKKGVKVRIVSLDDPSRAHPQAEFIRADLTRFENCLKACKEMDYVFHLRTSFLNNILLSLSPSSISSLFLRQ